jgi:hypothetical protein
MERDAGTSVRPAKTRVRYEWTVTTEGLDESVGSHPGTGVRMES